MSSGGWLTRSKYEYQGEIKSDKPKYEAYVYKVNDDEKMHLTINNGPAHDNKHGLGSNSSNTVSNFTPNYVFVANVN